MSEITDVTALPDVSKHVQYGLEAISYAEQLPVETLEDMETASGMRQGIKDRVRAVKELLDPFIAEANRLHKSHIKKRDKITDPLDEAEGILNKKMVDWQIEEDKRIAAEQKEADEKAKLDAAIAAEEEGNDALSEAIIEDQVPVTAAPVEKAKTKGVSFTETWKCEVTDMKALIKAVCADTSLTACLLPNMTILNQMAAAQKADMKVAGVKAFAKKGIKSKPTSLSKRGW